MVLSTRNRFSALLLLVAWSLFFSLAAVAQVPYSKQFLPVADYTGKPFPPYQEVIAKLFTEYQTDGLPEYYQYSLLKAPEGWFVYERYPYTPEVAQKHQLYWSAARQDYVPLSLTARNADDTTFTDYPLPPAQELESFKQQLFYGYPEWHNDVIKVLQQVENPTPDQLNALARAYGYKASHHLNPRAAYQPLKPELLAQVQAGTVPAAEIETGTAAYWTAIATYKKLVQAAPAYTTPVGTATLKYWNEHLAAYIDLMQLDRPDLARSFLADGLYNTYYLNFARNLLNSCAQNAILYTNGDTDLFALLYAQEKHGIRPDVTVINISLTNMELYLHYLLAKLPEPKRINSAIGVAPYASPDSYYINFSDSLLSRKGNVAELLQALAGKRTDLVRLEKGAVGPYWYADTRTWALKVPATPTPRTLQIKFTGDNTDRATLFLLDLIENNPGRPVYFGRTMSRASISLLKPYLRAEGLAYRLDPTVAPASGEEIKIDLPATMHFLNTKFTMAGATGSQVHDFVDDKFASLVVMQRRVFEETCQQLLLQNRKTDALKYARQCLEQMPASLARYDYYSTGLAAVFYANNQPQEGDKILKSLLKQLAEYSRQLKANRQLAADNGQLQVYGYMAQQVQTTATNYNRTALKKEADEQFNFLMTYFK